MDDAYSIDLLGLLQKVVRISREWHITQILTCFAEYRVLLLNTTTLVGCDWKADECRLERPWRKAYRSLSPAQSQFRTALSPTHESPLPDTGTAGQDFRSRAIGLVARRTDVGHGNTRFTEAEVMG